MNNYILAIDIGTTSTKVVAFSYTGHLLQKCSNAYSILSPHPSFKEQNPEEIYKALMSATKQIIEQCGQPQAISFSSAMHSLIAMDHNHQTLTNSIIWADGRSQDYADELVKTDLGKSLYQQTGTPIHPMSPLCKIAWIRDHQPNIFEETAKFISIKEYVLLKWFGQYIVDESIASATGLFDINKRVWCEEALEYCRIDKEQLSEVVATTAMINNWQADVLEELEIREKTPVIIGASDGCLANLGAGVKELGKAVMSIGTSAAIRMTHHTPIPDTATQLFNYILDEKHYVIGGASNNGGAVYAWLQKILDKKVDAERISIGAERLLFLPYLLGERAPIWNTNTRAAFIGLGNQHTEAHLVRATLEGIIFNIYQIAQALQKATLEIKEIYASGGFTQNDLAMQILANVFNAKVCLQEHEEGTALGAAILAMQALEIEYIPENEAIGKTFHPDLEAHQIYQQYFRVWK
ncbi:MAG: gluconokinase, partial [Bacteroidota bacterium]